MNRHLNIWFYSFIVIFCSLNFGLHREGGILDPHSEPAEHLQQTVSFLLSPQTEGKYFSNSHHTFTTKISKSKIRVRYKGSEIGFEVPTNKIVFTRISTFPRKYFVPQETDNTHEHLHQSSLRGPPFL